MVSDHQLRVLARKLIEEGRGTTPTEDEVDVAADQLGGWMRPYVLGQAILQRRVRIDLVDDTLVVKRRAA